MLTKYQLEKCSTKFLENLYNNQKLDGIPKHIIIDILRTRNDVESMKKGK